MTASRTSKAPRAKPPVEHYSDIAWQYARDVVDGTVIAPRFVILACKRALNDLARAEANDPGFPFSYDPYKAFRVCWWTENHPHVEGPLTGQFIRLEPWQVFVFCQIFGWVCTSVTRKGYRRFRRSFLAVPKGNGKSAMSSPIANFMLAADGESGAQIVSSATTQKQARIIFDVSRQMALHPTTAKLMKRTGVKVSAHTVTVPERFSRFNPLTSKGKTKDGLNLHGVFADEIHAYDKRESWDNLVSGAGKRPQSLIWVITTAGFDLGGVGYEQYTYVTQVLEGVVEDETQFGIVWTLDPEDDWTSEAVWAKVNPNWGISVDIDMFRTEARQAISVPATRGSFKTKRLNIWSSDTEGFFDVDAIQSELDPELDITQFYGRKCYGGIDLGSSSDLTARALLFPEWRDYEDEDGNKNRDLHITMFLKLYLTDQAAKESRVAQYRGWVDDGHMICTDGNVTDYNVLKRDLIEDTKNFDVQWLGYDGWNAAQLVQECQDLGLPMLRMPQNVQTVSPAAKELDRVTRAGRFAHNNPVFVWMASNAVVFHDYNGNVKPRKIKTDSHLKIDGIVAAQMAVALILEHETVTPLTSFVFV